MAMAVCFGELLVDMVSDRADASLQEAPRFLKAPGGAPANVAVGLARMGVASRFIGQVGDDPFGSWLRSILQTEGVDVSSLLSSATARTTIAFVATRSDGKKDICFYRNPGADALLGPDDVHDTMFEGVRVFHCGSVSLSQSPCRQAQFRAAEIAKARQMLVSYDPNWRPSLWPDHAEARQLIWSMMPLCDIVKLADEEWEFITGTTDWNQGAAQIREQGPRLVVVTRGEQGAYYNCEGACGELPAFMAGLLSQILAQETLDAVLNENVLPSIVRFANACGALTTQTAGAIPALPTRKEVEGFLQKA